MKYLPKLVRIILVLILSVLILLFSAGYLMQDRVSGIILSAINKNIATRIEVGSMKLSFLRSFPRASVQLRDLLVHASPGFNSGDFKGIGGDTLLFAGSAFMIFHPLDIYRGIYNIETIATRSGKVNLFSDRDGMVNYDLNTAEKNDTTETTIDLESINLSDMTAGYLNRASGFGINGLIRNGRLRSKIKGSNIDFIAKSDVEINSIGFDSTTITHPFAASVDMNLQSNKAGVIFGKSKLAIDDFDFGIEGKISSGNNYDLKISGNNIDIKSFMNYLPEKFSEKASVFNPSGKLIVNCFIKGPLTKTKNPHVEIEYNLKNGRIANSESKLAISNISFTGKYSNGAVNASRSSSVSLNDLKISLGSSVYTGSLLARNFLAPVTEITLKGRIFPAEIREFFGMSDVSLAGGSIDADLKILTRHRLKDSVTINDFIDMQTEGRLVFDKFSIGLAPQRLVFKNVTGGLAISETYTTSGLSFEYKDQKIRLKGEYRNVPEWFAGRPVTLFASGDIWFDQFLTDAFTSPGSDTSANKPVNFPSDIILDITFSIDKLKYKTFTSSNIKGALTYKPKLLTIKSLKMNSLEGSISGNGFIVQNANKTFISRGDFEVNNVDIKEAFGTFKNFGQNFIVRENLSGDLSGSISILLPLGPDFRARPRELTAQGKYVVVDGALTNFEPVKKLSSFIELSELENIHFEKLENDFFIRNNSIVIPQMDVKSSAADLTVNGRHSFENNYEYHVKVLLSQILSKKRRSAKKINTEFGPVKDDGLGRTAMLLKVENNGEEVKVSYDIKAVGQEINNNLKSEKKVLRQILDEEYGRNEASAKPTSQPVQNKNRFNITWEETDSVPAAVKEEEQKGFRNLFRKK